ncbi:MAG TPA: hypothetical protein VGB70_12030 [Allosphingosinicella sp.]
MSICDFQLLPLAGPGGATLTRPAYGTRRPGDGKDLPLRPHRHRLQPAEPAKSK